MQKIKLGCTDVQLLTEIIGVMLANSAKSNNVDLAHNLTLVLNEVRYSFLTAEAWEHFIEAHIELCTVCENKRLENFANTKTFLEIENTLGAQNANR